MCLKIWNRQSSALRFVTGYLAFNFEDLIPEYTVFSPFPFSPLFPSSMFPQPFLLWSVFLLGTSIETYKHMGVICIQTITNMVVVSSHLGLTTSYSHRFWAKFIVPGINFLQLIGNENQLYSCHLPLRYVSRLPHWSHFVSPVTVEVFRLYS